MVVIGVGNRTDTRSGLRKDARDYGSAIVGAGNRMDARSTLGGDAGDNESVVVDDGLTARDDGLAARDNGLAVDNDGSVVNQGDAGPGNGPDADLIMTTTIDIRADLIQDFNNGVSIVILARLSCIVPNKHAMDSSARIFADVINNLFRDMSPFSMTLPSSLLLFSLPASTTSNSGNIPTTFIYYILICMENLVSSQ